MENGGRREEIRGRRKEGEEEGRREDFIKIH